MSGGYLDHDLLMKLSNIPLEARQGMSGSVSGRHKSVHRGSSVEFSQYRKYVSGDDTKRLDWKAFARSDKYFIKEYEADTNMRVYILMDVSGSMGFAEEGRESKYHRACRLAANIAYVAIGQGDAVGMVFSRKSEGEKSRQGLYLIPPSRRPAHMRLLLNELMSSETKGLTSVTEDIHELAERAPRRSMVIVFSDLFTDTSELKDALNHLKFRKNDVAVFHLVDEVELDLKLDRPLRFVDMEGTTSVVAEPALIREEYKTVFHSYMNDVRQACFDSNSDYFVVKDTDNWQEVVTQFFMNRLKKKK